MPMRLLKIRLLLKETGCYRLYRKTTVVYIFLNCNFSDRNIQGAAS